MFVSSQELYNPRFKEFSKEVKKKTGIKALDIIYDENTGALNQLTPCEKYTDLVLPKGITLCRVEPEKSRLRYADIDPNRNRGYSDVGF